MCPWLYLLTYRDTFIVAGRSVRGLLVGVELPAVGCILGWKAWWETSFRPVELRPSSTLPVFFEHVLNKPWELWTANILPECIACTSFKASTPEKVEIVQCAGVKAHASTTDTAFDWNLNLRRFWLCTGPLWRWRRDWPGLEFANFVFWYNCGGKSLSLRRTKVSWRPHWDSPTPSFPRLLVFSAAGCWK